MLLLKVPTFRVRGASAAYMKTPNVSRVLSIRWFGSFIVEADHTDLRMDGVASS